MRGYEGYEGRRGTGTEVEGYGENGVRTHYVKV